MHGAISTGSTSQCSNRGFILLDVLHRADFATRIRSQYCSAVRTVNIRTERQEIGADRSDVFKWLDTDHMQNPHIRLLRQIFQDLSLRSSQLLKMPIKTELREYAQRRAKTGPYEDNLEVDALVVGGGFGGVFCFYQLRKAGFKTVIYEVSTNASHLLVRRRGLTFPLQMNGRVRKASSNGSPW